MDTEERAARAAVRRAGAAAEVLRTGIGAELVTAGFRAALERHASGSPPLIILFGLAGALDAAPDAPPIDRVVDEHGRTWACTVTPPLPTGEGFVPVVGVDRLAATPADKANLRRVTGALLVDMESHALAAVAAAKGVPFAVVRGVSDGPGHELPPQTLNWVTPQGVSRPGRFVRDVALRPWLIPTVVRTMPQVFRGLRAARDRLTDLLRAQREAERAP